MLKRLSCAIALSFCLFGAVYGNSQEVEELNKAFADIRANVGGDALLLEAQTFEVGIPEKGIPADMSRALKLYSQLYKLGNPIAAYKLGIFAWELQYNKDAFSKELVSIVSQTDGLDPALYFKNGSQQNKEIRYQEIAMLNGVTLGIYLFFYKDYKESIVALNARADIADYSLSQLYLAFNYLKLNDTKMANFYLNKACFNPKPQGSVMKFCSDEKFVAHKQGISQ